MRITDHYAIGTRHALKIGTVGPRARHAVGVFDVVPTLPLAILDQL